ncbi:RDD family protein [Pseudomonas granadensis]|uniref:RDD family protein n=1 Tax=Pseudomonas granadensis TaxID=1421430 RepID=UPI0019D28AD5|nr:RDD family protein [Pseudomonas granadensis]MBN6773996.1 RDD family protein [Pseudomonas granadensis]MBN6804395.1 RDD family protein [Pseudomonas granadensis]MBN6831541.1 RDD family protein [Pseudomonas granadensis]MBN6839070.1 RDD family protein [Pseudomonas granadensis]MBN6868314.1 RDD family protein [Pseudomonas granadensis]
MLEPTAPPRKAPLALPLDTRYQVETPEGIDLPLRPAGLPVRALAFTIDLALRGVIMGVLFTALAFLGKLGMGLGSLLLFAISWWYMVLFEVLRQGCSPGKQWMGLRVVHDDGTPVGWSASLLRNLLRFVDLLPFGYFLGTLSCLHHPTFKRLGDIAAGTLVVYSERPLTRPQLPEAQARRSPVPLTLKEQRAVLSFAERQNELSPARVNELAALLAQPLHISAPKAVAELNGIARGLLGPT